MNAGRDMWPLIAAERRRLATDLSRLSEQDWATPSLCAGWTARDVASHLVMPLGKSTARLMWRVISYRFDFDRMTVEEAAKDKRSGPELASMLEEYAEWRFAPPGMGPVVPLTEVVAHGQDIRRPLRLPYRLEPETARIVLDFLASPKATRGFVKKGHLAGLEWRVTNVDWVHGSGPVVSGPSEAVLMAMLGRQDAYRDLSGPGLEVLASR